MIRPIRTDADLDAAIAEIERLFDAEPGTPDGDRVEVLAVLVADYERRRYPVPKASPLGVLKFMMEQNGRTQTELAKLIGSRSRASEILAGKRALSKRHIRAISSAWHIPAGALI